MLYVKLTMPDFNGLALRSFKECRSFTSLNSAFPPPKTRGLIIRRNSSIKPRFIKLDTRVAPPKTTMSLPGCCFILRISSTSLMILVVFQAACKGRRHAANIYHIIEGPKKFANEAAVCLLMIHLESGSSSRDFFLVSRKAITNCLRVML